jgi:hypothetical protein
LFYESATAAKHTGKAHPAVAETAFNPMNPVYVVVEDVSK